MESWQGGREEPWEERNILKMHKLQLCTGQPGTRIMCSGMCPESWLKTGALGKTLSIPSL